MSVLGTANAGSLIYPMFCPVEASPESVMEMYLAAVLCPVVSAIPQLAMRTTKNKTHIVIYCGTFSAKFFSYDSGFSMQLTNENKSKQKFCVPY